LLECGGCTIKKVAWQVGYKRQSAFARRFKGVLWGIGVKVAQMNGWEEGK